MRKCELCECSARMYCESDQASLCRDCDEKVHGANFLVAKHSRCLLCHACQSPTRWKASGPKLGPTVSVCDACVAAASAAAARCGVSEDDDKTFRRDNGSEGTGGGHDETDDEDDYADEDDDEEEDLDVEDGDDDDENQVVPWSRDSQSPPPPPVSSPSCSGDEDVPLKRMGDFADLSSDDQIGCFSQPASSEAITNEEAATHTAGTTSLSSLRPLKQPRTTMPPQDHGQQGCRSTAIISSLQRLQNPMIKNHGDDPSATNTIIGICRLSRDETRPR